jgi:hypothetical protein
MTRLPIALCVLLGSLLWTSGLRAQSAAVPNGNSEEAGATARAPERAATAGDAPYSPRWGLVAGGLAMFSLGWGPLCAAGRDERCIPVVGAGIVVYRLWTHKYEEGESDFGPPPRFVAILASGLVWLQVAGATFTTVGFAVPSQDNSSSARVGIVPWVDRGTLGVSTSGQF